MKVQSLLLSIFLICNGHIAYADALSRTRNDTLQIPAGTADVFGKTTPELIYAYTDFNFKSTHGASFNSFKGHSNLYSVGGDHISLGPSAMAGLYYFRIDTALSSQFLLLPGAVTTSDQTIRNTTLFGHVLKIFTPQLYADVAAGYGYNKLHTYAYIDPSPAIPVESVAHARNSCDNWFVILNGIYRKTWQKFLLRANLGVLYSQIDTGSYHYLFPATNIFRDVRPLTNKATLLLENAEFGYFVNPKLMPFLSGGLIQVAQFSNSRVLVDAANIINGSLPQLNMNKSGFRVGGGIAYTYKNVSMRIEEKYYNAGGTFQSYETLAALEYQFN